MTLRLPILSLSASLLALAGCPDPNGVAGGAPALEEPTAVGPPPVDGAPPMDAPPSEPSAMPPGDPSATGATGSSAGRPAAAAFHVEPGKGVQLSGTVSYAGSASGTLRIDFLKNPAGSTFPELVHTLTLAAPGAWSVEAPADIGEISIVAFLDANDDGPGPGEPAGMIERTTVGATPMASLDITLSDTPELGSLKPGAGPGAAPQGGSVAPPPTDAAPAPGDGLPAGAAAPAPPQ